MFEEELEMYAEDLEEMLEEMLPTDDEIAEMIEELHQEFLKKVIDNQ